MEIRMNSKNCNNAMKKIFTKLMLWAVVATALVSCENNFEDATINGGELTQTVTLSANKPTEVRTELIEGVPYWSKGDQIGVYTSQVKDADNYAFANDNNEATLTTSFTGTTAVANTLFVYYPYTNFSNPVTEKGVKVEILANQEPTAASFDGRTDLMIAKPVTLDAEGKQLSDLEFARVAAIVKIVLKDKTGNLAGQHVSSLTMTAATNLVGRLYLDVVNQEIFTGEGGGLYYGGAKSVNATYTEATQYEVNGENATYVVVYPQTLATGSKLSFEASTEGYAITKEITLPSDIELLAGKVTTLNVSLATENIVTEATGLALPFEDDFAWVTGTSESTDITASLKAEYYATGAKAFSANGAIKFGTGSVAGSITTVPLNLSEPFTVIVKAKKYGSDNTKIKAVVGETSQQITLTADYAYYGIEFEAATKKSSLTLEAVNASSCRFYIDELQVVAGHDVVLPTLPPVLTVSTAEISGVSHEGEAKTFTYSVANPVEGVSATVTDNADWITTADNNGTVTVTVAANEAEEAREGVVTVTYGDLTKTVTVKQNAKPAAGGDVVTVSTVGFESSEGFTASTTYNNTSVKYFGKSGKQWGTICGTATTSDAITGSQSMQMRVYKSTGPKDPYVFMNYQEASVSKISFKAKGSVTTNSLTLSYKTTGDWVTVKTYSLKTSAQEFTHEFDTALENVSFKFTFVYPASYTDKSKITIDDVTFTSGGNAGGGSTPEPETPVLSINPTTLSFDAAAASKTVTCTIENEVSGVNVTATENVDWLSTSVSGTTVTITATENTGAEREADVTIAYEGAESKTVTVSQAAAEVGGGEGGEATPETKTISFTGGSGSNQSTISFTSVSPLSCVITANGNQTSPRLDSNMVRMYASDGKSNKMTITTTSSPKKKITKVVVTATSSSYATALGSGSATVDSGASVSIATSGSTVTYTITGNTETIEILTSGQARLSKVDVTYQ